MPFDGAKLAEELFPVVREMIREAVSLEVMTLRERVAVLEAREPIGLGDAIKDADGHLHLVLSNGSTKDIGRVEGRDGVNPTVPDVEALVQSAIGEAVPKAVATAVDGVVELIVESEGKLRAEIEAAIAAAPAPDLSGLAKTIEVTGAIEAVADRLAEGLNELEERVVAAEAMRGSVADLQERMTQAGAAEPDVATAVARATQALAARIEYLEKAPPPDLSDLVTRGAMAEAVGAVAKAVAEIPPPPDHSQQIEELAAGMTAAAARDAELERRLAELPAPPDLSGLATKVEARELAAELLPHMRDLEAQIAAVETRMREAIAGVRVPDPIPGKDGVSVVTVKQNADGEAIFKLSNGETINAGLIRGTDGLSVDDLSIDFDGERRIRLSMGAGESQVSKELVVPWPIDRGAWRQRKYERGDGTSYRGCWWLATCDTEAKPGTNGDWRLAIKKGRDGNEIVRREEPAGPPQVKLKETET